MIDLGIRLEDFDGPRSIGMRQAREKVRGRKGAISIEVLRRWCSPKHGCRPQGENGPVLVLPAVRIGNELRTMPEWVELFLQKRIELGSRLP